MKAFIFLIISIILVPFSHLVSAHQIGFSQLQLTQNPERILEISLWYPAAKEPQLSQSKTTSDTLKQVLIADNIAFKGTKVIKNAPLLIQTSKTGDTQKRPLVLLSHGYRGSWRNLNWLASKLVQKGFIAVAVNHPGTTTFNTSATQAAKWWERPNDVKRTLDYLLNNSIWQQDIDKQKISAIGHSLGGWTVMQLVGAEFNREGYLAGCETLASFRSCQIKEELGLAFKQNNEPENTQLMDSRIKNAIILDLGLARSFSQTSLNKLNSPVLILAAGIDIGDLPQAQESGFLAEHLTLEDRRYKVYEKATHFSFMQECKPNAIAILEEEAKGDGIICKDGVGSTRAALHDTMFEDILAFLKQEG